MQSTRPVTRGRRQRGNAALESALIILPLLAMGFALMDFALVLFIQNTMRAAVREGVRFAVTQQTGPSGQDAAIKSTVESYAMGFLGDSDITIQYYDDTLTAVSGANSNKGGNLLVVSATIQRKWMAPLWRDTGLLSLSASSADVMEPPSGATVPTR